MPKMQSRRELLTLAVATAATADAALGSDGPNRHFVNRFELGLAPRGEALRARLTATAGRVFESDVALGDASDHLLKLVRMALDGRGRFAVEVDNDDKTIRAFRFEAP